MKKKLVSRARNSFRTHSSRLESLESRQLLSANVADASVFAPSEVDAAVCGAYEDSTAPIALDASCLTSSASPAAAGAAAPAASKTVVVTSLGDTTDASDGVTTLREAISAAKAGDTIAFDPSIAGGTITLRGEPITISSAITVDGLGLDITLNGAGVSGVFNASASVDEGPVTLRGLRFVNSGGETGAVYGDSSLVVADCSFDGNKSTLYGGGICSHGPLVVERCSFRNNSAVYSGGGIFAYTTLHIVDSSFVGNTATTGGGSCSVEDAVIENTRYEQNTADSGAAMSLNGSANVVNCVVDGNTGGANAVAALRSGKDNAYSFTNCVFTKNHATNGSSVFYLTYGSIDITNCTIADNSSSYRDGVYLSGIVITRYVIRSGIYNSVIVGNRGVFDYDHGVYLTSNTTVSNTIFDEDFSHLSETAILYNAELPLFTDASNGDYTLAEGSQALDCGNNSAVKTTFDIEGKKRIANGTVDLGAYETVPSEGIVGEITVVGYDAESGALSIAWDELDSTAERYAVLVSDDNGSTWTTAAENLTALEYQASGILAGNAYEFIIRGYTSAGDELPIYISGFYAPVALSVNVDEFWIDGEIIASLSPSSANAAVRWYRVTAEGETEIESARDRFSYTPTAEDFDVDIKITAVGRVGSVGSDASVVISRAAASEVPSVVVTTAEDVVDAFDGVVSLREAMELYGRSGDTITFDPSLAGSVVNIAAQKLKPAYDFTIDGGHGGVTLSGDCEISAFYVDTLCTLTLKNLTFTNFSMALHNLGTTTATNCVFIGNGRINTDSSYPVGGAINNVGALELVDCVFDGNRGLNGGAIYISTYVPSALQPDVKTWATNCVFVNNTAVYGGAVYNDGGNDVCFDGCLFTDNSAETGGGFYQKRGYYTNAMEVKNSTIADNSPTAIYVSENSYFILSNTIVAGEITTFSDGRLYGFNNLTLYGAEAWYNGSSDNYVYDPSLPLFTDAAAGDYTLASGSQAIDRGSNALSTSATDLAGRNRYIGGSVDIGVYEAQDVSVQVGAVTARSYDAPTGKAMFRWDAIDGAATYSIETSADGGVTWTTAASGFVNTYKQISGIAAETPTLVRVTGHASDGSSVGRYAEGGFDGLNVGEITVKSYDAAAGKATLRWDAIDGASLYRLEYSVDGGASWSVYATGFKNTYKTLSGIAAETEYLFRVTGLDAAKTSVGKYADCLFSWTRVGDATVKAYDPAAGKVTLRWDAIPEASYYRLEASVDGGITWDVASACFRNTYKTVAGVDPSASYVFRVTALNAAKKSIGLYADCSFNADVNANALLDEAFAGYFDNLL